MSVTKLYTLPDCPNCTLARQVLTQSGKDFSEVVLDTESEASIRQSFGRVIAPLLERDDGFYLLGQQATGEHVWLRIHAAGRGMETVREFAGRYRVKVRKDSCGDEIIPGRAL